MAKHFISLLMALLLFYPLSAGGQKELHPSAGENENNEEIKELNTGPELPKTIYVEHPKSPDERTVDQWSDLFATVQAAYLLGSWRDVINLTTPVFDTDFYSLKDDSVKSIYIQLMGFRGIAAHKRIMWDKYYLKMTFLYLEELSETDNRAGEFVELLRPYVDSLIPEERPSQSLSSDMHFDRIAALDHYAEGNLVATASSDKSLKIWDGETGRLLKTFYPPFGDNKEGRLFAVAFDPRGERIACAGFTGMEWDGTTYIYIINLDTGALERRLETAISSVTSLAYSPDGSYLFHGGAMWEYYGAYETSGWSKVLNQFTKGVGEECPVIVPHRKGFYVLLENQGVLAYDYNFNIVASRSPEENKIPSDLSYDPAGERIAVAYRSGHNIDVLDAGNLSTLYSIDKTANARELQWSAGGALYAGGHFARATDSDEKEYALAYLENPESGDREYIIAGTSVVSSLSTDGKGSVFYSTSRPEWGKVSRTNSLFMNKAENLNLRTNSDRNILSMPVGTDIAFQSASGEAYHFDLMNRSLVPYDGFEGIPRLHDFDGRTLKIGRDIEVNGKRWTHFDNIFKLGYMFAGSLLFQSDNILWSDVNGIYMTDGEGRRIWQNWDVGAVCYSILGTWDGRFAIGAFDDGTLRWFDLNTGSLLLTLILNPVDLSWILYTPDGYYDCSDEAGASLVGWKQNNSGEELADFYTMDQYSNLFYKPSEIDRILNRDQRTGEIVEKPSVPLFTPPRIPQFEVNGISIDPGFFILPVSSDTTDFKATFTVESSTGDLSGIAIFRNNRPLSFFDLMKSEQAKSTVQDDGTTRIDLEIPLIELENNFRIFFRDKNGITSAERLIQVYYSDEKAAPPYILANEEKKLTRKGDLHLLTVGVHLYDNPQISDLLYTDDDARKMTELFQSQNSLYRRIHSHSLETGNSSNAVSREDILTKIREIKSNIKEGDTLILYLSGHGTRMDDKYYFLTTEANPENADLLEETSLSWNYLARELEELVKAEEIFLFIDSCFSGGISARELGYLFEDRGVTLLMSSRGDQVSIEMGEFEQGLFSFAIREAFGAVDRNISGDANRDDVLTVGELMSYISDRVNGLTGGIQTPWLPDYSPELTEKVIGIPLN